MGKSGNTVKNIIIASTIIVAAIGLAIVVGIKVSESSAFDKDFYKDTSTLFNPATYMGECIAPSYEQYISEYTKLNEEKLRFYGEVRDIEKQMLGDKVTFSIKVPKFNEKTNKLIEAEQYILCESNLDLESYPVFEGDNIFIYGESVKIDKDTSYPIFEVLAIEIDV